ncbi:bacterial DNA polymerase III alpha subunit [Mycobacterium xenopi 3993]|nr:bacterial DNA polymerase III alpha subunit [Mycobacterium xenopi 3993]
MPVFPVPDGHDQASWLRHEVEAGLARRFPDGIPPGYAERAAYEIEVICAKGFPSYFLIVADLVNYARSVNIRVGPGRGSAAGSLVAYALGITDIDPIPHGLLFERFLNPSARRCPTSTSTSTIAAAARWFDTPPTSGAMTGSPR